MEIHVVALAVNERSDTAPEVQRIITRFGPDILGRMGIPSTSKEEGIITLVMSCPEETVKRFVSEVTAVKGITANYMRVK